jgi:hypothetical protein
MYWHFLVVVKSTQYKYYKMKGTITVDPKPVYSIYADKDTPPYMEKLKRRVL